MESFLQMIYIKKKTNILISANELLALDNLSCRAFSELYDQSQADIKIYYCLRHVEISEDVSVLEEAGRLLAIQRTAAPPPDATTTNTTTATDVDHAQIPGYEYYGNHDLPLRPRPNSTRNPDHDLFSHSNPSQSSAHTISNRDALDVSNNHASAASMITTANPLNCMECLNFHNNNHTITGPVALGIPSRASAHYPISLATDAEMLGGGNL